MNVSAQTCTTEGHPPLSKGSVANKWQLPPSIWMQSSSAVKLLDRAAVHAREVLLCATALQWGWRPCLHLESWIKTAGHTECLQTCNSAVKVQTHVQPQHLDDHLSHNAVLLAFAHLRLHESINFPVRLDPCLLLFGLELSQLLCRAHQQWSAGSCTCWLAQHRT